MTRCSKFLGVPRDLAIANFVERSAFRLERCVGRGHEPYTAWHSFLLSPFLLLLPQSSPPVTGEHAHGAPPVCCPPPIFPPRVLFPPVVFFYLCLRINQGSFTTKRKLSSSSSASRSLYATSDIATAAPGDY